VDLNRRECCGALIACAAAPAWAQTSAVTPEQFGAKGDGVTNDTDAFARMADHINRMGGGQVSLRRRTYIVGRQIVRGRPDFVFAPAPIMDFNGCTAPLIIRGNGARLRAASGLRCGTFDRATLAPTRHAQPFYRPGEIATPYFAMIGVTDCTGPIEINALELDGNSDGLHFGGPWGDTGWQIGCNGLKLKNNRGPITLSNIHSHHHAQDGGMGDGPGVPGRRENVLVRDCRFISNGRNGWSLVGGVGWRFERCTFSKSARNLAFPGSAPKAGIDFEAEGGKFVSAVQLIDCIAEDNAGVGCLHPGAKRVSDVYWQGGRIVGTTRQSYYGGDNEGILFRNTLFLGMVFSLSREAFEDCTFSDDVKLSPTGALHNPHGFIIPDCVTRNRFTRCKIVHTRPGDSVNGNRDQALFEDCLFRSANGAGRLDVYGHFRGAGTRFVTDPGGTDFLATPAGKGRYFSGAAEDSFSVTMRNGTTRTYPPTTRGRRPG
jgi:hypothetical protein